MPRPKKEPKPKRETHTGGAETVEGIRMENPLRGLAFRPTLLWSFNQAVGGGIPDRSIMEIAGYEYVGKSTLAEHFGGYIAGARTLIVLPFEATDPRYLVNNVKRAGFSGTIWNTPYSDKSGKALDNETMLDAFLDKLEEDESVGAGIFDSISAFSPVAESEGSVREAHMGLKARIMANFMRRCENVLQRRRKESANVFLVNHLHPNLGVPGANTSGGKAIHNHSTIRIRLVVQDSSEDGTLLVEGKVVKVRFLNESDYRATFKVVLKKGVHVGLTAVQDCLDQGLATKDNGIIKIGAKSFGRHSLMMEKHWNDPKLFEPFTAALEGK